MIDVGGNGEGKREAAVLRRGGSRCFGAGGSRLKSGVERIFEVYVEVALVADQSKPTSSSPRVVRKFPPDYDEEGVLKSVANFAFPSANVNRKELDHGIGSSIAVQSFTFVKTEEDSSFLFGFCRQSCSRSAVPITACILTFLPWHNAFKKMLDVLAEISHQKEDIMTMLCQVYTHPVLVPNEVEHFNVGVETFSLEAPDIRNRLPSVPGDVNMTEYYSLETQDMISIFAAMLHERRVLFISKSLKKLTSCVFAAESLIYPMYWQHIFIPVLPESLVDYISAPMPYLIGVSTELFESKVKSSTGMLGDAVIVDLDRNQLHTEYNDVESLPSHLLTELKKKLKNSYSGGDVIARAFLNVLVSLIGGYREALTFLPNQKIQFDETAFLASRPTNMKDFAESLLRLQIFQQFIEGRLTYLNQGEGFCDERDIFEKECSLVKIGQKAGDHYQVWLRDNGKRLGARLVSAGKGVRRVGEKGGKKIRGKMKELSSTVKGGFDDHVLKEKFRNSAKEIRDTNRTGGSSGSGSLDKSSLGSDSIGLANSAPNSPVLRPLRPATSYVPPRAFTPEYVAASSQDDLRPRSAAFGVRGSGGVGAQQRRVTDDAIKPSDGSASSGLIPASRKYRVIADDDEDDDDGDEDDDDNDESYDEAELSPATDASSVTGPRRKKTPPLRPPAPYVSTASDSSLPRVSLNLFDDPDILLLIDKKADDAGKAKVENAEPDALIPSIPAPVPPPRRKRTGSGIPSDVDLPVGVVPGRPGEPPVSIRDTAPTELISFGVHESALAAASKSLASFSTADFDPLNGGSAFAALDNTSTANAHPVMAQQQRQPSPQPMEGKNFHNPLYNANVIHNALPSLPPKTHPYGIVRPNISQKQQPNNFQSSQYSSPSSSTLTKSDPLAALNRLSGNNNNNFQTLPHSTTTNSNFWPPKNNVGESTSSSLFGTTFPSVATGNGAITTTLNADDERLLQEWSLLSLDSKGRSNNHGAACTSAAISRLEPPHPPTREKSSSQRSGGRAAASTAPTSDPFGDLVTF